MATEEFKCFLTVNDVIDVLENYTVSETTVFNYIVKSEIFDIEHTAEHVTLYQHLYDDGKTFFLTFFI